MNLPRPAEIARRLFVSVRREGPSAELRERILTAGRAEVEGARRAPERLSERARQRDFDPGPRLDPARQRPASGARRWLAVGALAAAAAVLVYVAAGRAPEHGVTISAERTGQPAPARGAEPTSGTPREAPGADAPPTPPAPARAAPAAAKPEKRMAAPKTQAPRAPPASLGEQLEQIKRARAALRGGDHRRALELLDAYRAQPTRGELAEEASLLRIEALALAGQREAAAEAARQFASDYPTSPLIDRALSYAATGVER